MRTNCAAGRPGDRLADGRLARARRTDERENDAGPARVDHAPLAPQLAHGKVLGDALLHVVQPLVIRIQHLAGVDGIQALFGPLRPGHGQQPVEIGADGRRLGVRVTQPLEARELAVSLLPHRFGHAGVGDLLRDSPRWPSRRLRRAPCGWRPSACAGSSRAAASGRRFPRPRGSACGPRSSVSRSCWNFRASASRCTTSSVSSSWIFCSAFRSGE